MSLVAEPTTGVPSRQEISYIAVERGELEAEVETAQAAVNQANEAVVSLSEQLSAAQVEVAAKEAALAESKSLVAEHDSLTGFQAPVDEGSTGDGSEAEAQVEEVVNY